LELRVDSFWEVYDWSYLSLGWMTYTVWLSLDVIFCVKPCIFLNIDYIVWYCIGCRIEGMVWGWW